MYCVSRLTAQGNVTLSKQNKQKDLYWCVSKYSSSGLPWWLSGEEPTCQRRKHGFDPRCGKIPRDAEQPLLSMRSNRYWACTPPWEPELPACGLQLLRPTDPRAQAPATGEATPTRSLHTTPRGSPCLPQIENPVKILKIFKIFMTWGKGYPRKIWFVYG